MNKLLLFTACYFGKETQHFLVLSYSLTSGKVIQCFPCIPGSAGGNTFYIFMNWGKILLRNSRFRHCCREVPGNLAQHKCASCKALNRDKITTWDHYYPRLDLVLMMERLGVILCNLLWQSPENQRVKVKGKSTVCFSLLSLHMDRW